MKKIILYFFFGMVCMLSMAQNVGIGTTTPAAGSAADARRQRAQAVPVQAPMTIYFNVLAARRARGGSR